MYNPFCYIMFCFLLFFFSSSSLFHQQLMSSWVKRRLSRGWEISYIGTKAWVQYSTYSASINPNVSENFYYPHFSTNTTRQLRIGTFHFTEPPHCITFLSLKIATSTLFCFSLLALSSIPLMRVSVFLWTFLVVRFIQNFDASLHWMNECALAHARMLEYRPRVLIHS